MRGIGYRSLTLQDMFRFCRCYKKINDEEEALSEFQPPSNRVKNDEPHCAQMLTTMLNLRPETFLVMMILLWKIVS
ncbi:hypothetical protein RIR_jg37377.t1 [Rhizophagus irregularis DAOM 181602=DAOM 197198]|nr:hypothetical protein RIR_jg37377.t1 [Rhizophagus irregularis DAOM 181602=DAOM 197198]